MRSKQVPGEEAEASVGLAFFLRRFESNYSDSQIPESRGRFWPYPRARLSPRWFSSDGLADGLWAARPVLSVPEDVPSR